MAISAMRKGAQQTGAGNLPDRSVLMNLFEQMVREAISPVIARLEALAQLPELPADMVLQSMFQLFRTELLGTSRNDLLRHVHVVLERRSGDAVQTQHPAAVAVDRERRLVSAAGAEPL